MARSTSISKPVTRKVTDEHGEPLVVTLTAEGILFRRPRKQAEYLLPYAAAETRAQHLLHGIGAATGKRGNQKHVVSRGLLTT